MKKNLAVFILAAAVSFTLPVFANQDAADAGSVMDKTAWVTKSTADQVNKKEKKQKIVEPVNLDWASRRYDIVLPPQPVRVAADSLYMRNQDGYVQGRGNVDIQQGIDEFHSNYVEGNTKTKMYYIPGQAVWIQGETALDGSGITYDGNTHSGKVERIAGFIAPNVYIRGTDGELTNGNGYMKHGLITTPHAVAETPDYYLTGDDIHIYPGVKFTSENTALWFKHIRLLTYGHYEGNLDSQHKTNTTLFSLLPRPRYTSDDGFGIYGGATLPLNAEETFQFQFKYAIYTKGGFQPTALFIRDTSIGRFTLGYSTEESTQSTDRVWAKKFPELTYYMPRITFGRTGIYMDNSASWGRWSEDGVATGVHKDFQTEISHTPLPLWKKANIRFFAGYRKDTYGTDDSIVRDPYTGVVLNQGINERVWTSWWYTKHNMSGVTPYRFDTIDHPRQKGVSIGYKMTPLDTFILTFDKDLDTDQVADRDFTWVRDMHSFVATITWESVSRSWDFQLVAKDFF